ncbi:MAG: 16S rRNA (guanine(966)-N(2))-methyltransferase RsmD [Actinomycetota bacterium]
MRVIAGLAKGRRLKTPVTGTRPMTDRIKESIFSALGDMSGFSVLDLYAGSGSLGLEAISRGARAVMFVENSRDAIVKLEENIAATGFESQSDVLWGDVAHTIGTHAEDRVDVIFCDPPYSMSPDDVLSNLENLVMGGWLSNEGRIVLHRPSKERRLNPFGLALIWEREYGQSSVYIFTHEDEDE